MVPLVAIFACNNGKTDEFQKNKSGLKYKIVSKSDDTTTLKPGDYIELELKYTNSADSVLFNSKELGEGFKMQIKQPTYSGGSFEEALLMMHPGGHYQFIIPADSFYLKTKHTRLPSGVNKGSNLLFDVNLIRKVNKKEIEEERHQLELQMIEQQETLTQQYIAERGIREQPKESGLYYIELKKGTGPKAKQGDRLTVHYNGKFLDGRLFDSSYKRKEPFTFVLGENSVIPGWEEGFKYMNKGTKSIFIVPSKLAYGKEGYGNIIPPFATLVFEVELLNIENKK